MRIASTPRPHRLAGAKARNTLRPGKFSRALGKIGGGAQAFQNVSATRTAISRSTTTSTHPRNVISGRPMAANR
jgi:hypothetical protein